MMRRRNFIQAGIGFGLLPICDAATTKGALHWQDVTFTGLGTVMSIRAAHARADELNRALRRARQVIEYVEDDMSLFRPGSALSRLNKTGELHRPSDQLLQILQISQRVSAQSGGAFDVTVQPLWQLYAQAQKKGRLPSAQQVQDAQRLVGWQQLHVSAAKIKLMQPGMGVSLNGIAQGYAADLVRASLLRDGVEHALINTGEWSAIGMSDGQRPWTLAVGDPRHTDQWLTRVVMNGLCLATSADDQCAFSEDRRHHHIFNPHTGYSPSDISSVTVAAATCALADALTKVLFVGGFDRSLALAKTWGVSALVVKKNGQWQTSDSWPHVAA
jgi:FAD:protein FMN transferase